jgi:aldose 1-epimerase
VSRGGREQRLRHGDYTAVVTEVGGGLRLFRHGDRDLVLGYGEDEVRPRYRGALLAPWPNRVVDGRWAFEGREHQLALTEPDRGHALHGLVCWSRFELRERGPSAVLVSHRLVPQQGYPFEVEVAARYELGDDGLTCTMTLTNLGTGRAPVGFGPHPYLRAGDPPVDGWTLEVPADRVMTATPDRLIPVDVVSVDDADLDFRTPRRVGATEVDHAFTGLRPAQDGRVAVRVRSPDGGGVECAWDAATLPWVQVHTADLPPPEESRQAMAVEPMTCPPDALRSGTDLLVLEPGQSTSGAWTIRTC